MLLTLSGCGGGGGYDPGPLWVETDAVAADVDGDGRNDVLTLAMYQPDGHGTEEGHLLVYLQSSTPGVFAAPVSYSVGQYPWHMALADIDGDLKPDLVISDPTAGTTWLVLQDPARAGKFLAPRALIAGLNSYSAVIADLNDDGAPDVAVAGASRGLVIRYQDPAIRGTFAPQVDIALPGRSSDLAAGDIDGDGLEDVLAWTYTNPPGVYPPTAGFVVAYQKPGGGFDLAGPLALQTGQNVGRLAIADINADGHLDLFAFQTPFSSSYTTQLLVLPQTATPRAFAGPVYSPLAGTLLQTYDAVLADLNRDGVPDTATVGMSESHPGNPPSYHSRANLLINNGLGAFSLSTAIADRIWGIYWIIAAADLDGDGHNDIVVLGEDNQCLVMFQSSPGMFLVPRALH
jgi:hypothetical protein